jgi:quinol monooxygenase YgiN
MCQLSENPRSHSILCDTAARCPCDGQQVSSWRTFGRKKHTNADAKPMTVAIRALWHGVCCHRKAGPNNNLDATTQIKFQKQPNAEEDNMLYLIATLDAQPEHRETLMDAVKRCVAATVKEKGCISYDCFTSITEPNRFIFVERWESQDDLDAHGKSAHVQEWRALSRPLWTGPSAVEIITPANVFKR